MQILLRAIIYAMFFIPVSVFSQSWNAVCVGINDYPETVNDLDYCVNDATSIKLYLENYKNWDGSKIVLLTDSDASQTAIENKVSSMSTTAGNINFFHYAGHGDSRDLGGNRSDGIIPSNSISARITPSMLQYDFGSYSLSTAFLDACGSGIFPRDMRIGVISSACQANELTPESEELEHGYFTYYLLSGLSQSDVNTAEQLHNYAAPLMTTATGRHPQLGDYFNGYLSIYNAAYTLSGTLPRYETWSSPATLQGNVFVPTGVTLTLCTSLVLQLNNKVLTSSGGSIVLQGSTSSLNGLEAYIKSGSTTIGYAGSIQEALNVSSSGQTVYVSGTHLITNNITVPSGKNLEIASGAILQFNAGTQLLVNGKLIANGATFKCTSGTWKGIKIINADNSSRIENSHILNFGSGYGTDGIYIEGCNPFIGYNTITGTYNGIKIYNASPGIEGNTISGCTNGNGITIENFSKPFIAANHINNVYYHGISAYNNWNYGNSEACIDLNNNSINNSSINSYAGIRSYNSYLTAYENTITNFNFGFYAESNSVIDFGFDFGSNYFYYQGGNNEVHGCGAGLVANNSSILATGFISEDDILGGFCKIEGYTRYSIFASNHGEVQAELNYWGSGIGSLTPYCDATSYVTWDPVWDLRWGIMGTSSSLNKVTASTVSSINDESSSILKALLMVKERKYPEAKGILKALVDKGSTIALIHLSNLFFKSKDNDIIPYLEQKLSKFPNTSDAIPYKRTLLKLYHGIGEYAKVLNIADELISKADKEALIDKYLVYALDFADNDKALSILTEIEIQLGKERSDELYTLLLPEEHKSNVNEQSLAKQLIENSEQQPTGYALNQNYPNPFNPTTTIGYSIAKTSYVDLIVYDVSGKEIASLVGEVKEPGNYQATFDASKFTSGIYFYTIKAGDFVSTKKLVVLK